MVGVALTGLRFQDEIAELSWMNLQRAKSGIPTSLLQAVKRLTPCLAFEKGDQSSTPAFLAGTKKEPQ
jgi:hypothetical protein